VVGFFNLKNLELLDLSSNTLSNNILQTIRTMTSLKTLSLQNCSLSGQLPTAQGKVDDSYPLSKLYPLETQSFNFS
jgi:Leucine-rich repeat (LRR) protein